MHKINVTTMHVCSENYSIEYMCMERIWYALVVVCKLQLIGSIFKILELFLHIG